MADTLQWLSWHLEFRCPFRSGDAVTSTLAAAAAVSKLQTIDSCLASGDIYGDICVTAVSYSRDNKAPSGGFRISQAVAPAGGLPQARETCARCPANALDQPPARMAGCCGTLPFHPGDRELQSVLQQAITRNQLNAAFEQAFSRTTPLWYGLWINSPLTPPQLAILQKIIPDHPRTPHDTAQFRRACELAIERKLQLHVTMPPPGHTDFGFYTIFPHCPAVK